MYLLPLETFFEFSKSLDFLKLAKEKNYKQKILRHLWHPANSYRQEELLETQHK